MKKFFLIFIAILFLNLAPAGVKAQNIERLFYLSKAKEKQGIESIKRNAEKIDILAPQMYSVSFAKNSAKITGGLSLNLKKVIKSYNFKIMPLVTNAGFNQSIMHKLLISPTEQDRVITGLVYLAKRDKFIGWQFDFENISYLDKDLYSVFIEKTSKAFKKNNLIFSVAAVTRTVDFEDTDAFKNWGGVFDYARIAKEVDFISLMTYDDPDSVGPVASLEFVNNVLNYVKDKIPPEKLSLGIPLYNWGWRMDPLKKITASGTYKGLLYIKANFEHNLGFDASLGSSWLTYFYKNKQYKIWFQDNQSFENKLDIIKNNNFRGFSAWVLGIEDPAIWNSL